jgi:hypothetical protein
VKHTSGVNNELCLYVVEGDNVYPVLISDTPTSPTGNEVPKDIATFIRDNIVILTQVADMEIDGGRFFDALEEYIDSKKRLTARGRQK